MELEDLLRESFQMGQQWVHDLEHNNPDPVNFNEWFQSEETKNKIASIPPNNTTEENGTDNRN